MSNAPWPEDTTEDELAAMNELGHYADEYDLGSEHVLAAYRLGRRRNERSDSAIVEK